MSISQHPVAPEVRLLPLVEDTGWFFDTELLVLAERSGLRIHEVPVDWVDDPDSRVDIFATALADLRGIARLARGLATGRLPLPRPQPLTRQLLRFGAVGMVSTFSYLPLYAMLRTAVEPQAADLVALLATAIGNTAANRYLTFRVRGSARLWRHHAQGLVLFGLGLALTSGSLAALAAVSPQPARAVELTVLVVANLTATLLRFLLFRSWVFRGGAGEPGGLHR